LHLFHRQTDGATPYVTLALIASSAKGLVAGAGQHDDADVLVPAGLGEGLDEFLAGLRPKRVVDLGTVDGDGGYTAFFVVDDVFECRGSLSAGGCAESGGHCNPARNCGLRGERLGQRNPGRWAKNPPVPTY